MSGDTNNQASTVGDDLLTSLTVIAGISRGEKPDSTPEAKALASRVMILLSESAEIAATALGDNKTFDIGVIIKSEKASALVGGPKAAMLAALNDPELEVGE